MAENTAMAAELEACTHRISGLSSEMDERSMAAAALQEEVVQAMAAKHTAEVK